MHNHLTFYFWVGAVGEEEVIWVFTLPKAMG